MTVQANENNDGISLKSIVDGTGDIGKKIYETEVPPETIFFVISNIMLLVVYAWIFMLRFLASMAIFVVIFKLSLWIYHFCKYISIDKTKEDWDAIYNEIDFEKARGIAVAILVLPGLSFFISWVYYDKFPLFQVIQF